jgi:anaphase-promoting complex subunit 1
VFTATLLALNEARTGKTKGAWIFRLPAFKQFEMADLNLFMDSEERSSALLDLRGSAVDERLLLNTTATSGLDRDRLWNLRILLEWADRMALEGDYPLKWISREVLEKWKSIIQQRARSRSEAEQDEL